jgi:hypothetical protein
MRTVEDNSDLFTFNEDAEIPAKKIKMEPEFFQPPTADELYNLKNNESLYQSNLFRLQV